MAPRIVIVTALAAPAQAERLLLTHHNLKAFAPDNAVCRSTYQVNVLAPDAEMFSQTKPTCNIFSAVYVPS